MLEKGSKVIHIIYWNPGTRHGKMIEFPLSFCVSSDFEFEKENGVSSLKLIFHVPPTIKFVLDGEMTPYLLVMDLILQARK